MCTRSSRYDYCCCNHKNCPGILSLTPNTSSIRLMVLPHFWHVWISVKPFCVSLSLSLPFVWSRSGPKERWGTSSTTWSSSTRRLTTSCTKRSLTTSSSPRPWCPRDWRSGAPWPGRPFSNFSAKVQRGRMRYEREGDGVKPFVRAEQV